MRWLVHIYKLQHKSDGGLEEYLLQTNHMSSQTSNFQECSKNVHKYLKTPICIIKLFNMKANEKQIAIIALYLLWPENAMIVKRVTKSDLDLDSLKFVWPSPYSISFAIPPTLALPYFAVVNVSSSTRFCYYIVWKRSQPFTITAPDRALTETVVIAASGV